MGRGSGILAVSVLCALALGAGGGSSGGSDTAAGTRATPEGPSIAILSPEDGVHFETDHFDLKIAVANFTLNGSAIGKADVPGEGHVHLYVDGNYVLATADTAIKVEHLKPGKRAVRVELHNNNHTPLDPAVHDETHIEVVPHLSIGHPAQGDSVNTFEVEIEFHVENFVLEMPAGAPGEFGRGHIRWRVLKDGAPVTKDPEVLWKAAHTHAELKAPGCTFAQCVYTLEAWLANHDGSMVEGTHKLSVTFTVLPPDFGPVLGIGFTLLGVIVLGMLWALKRRPTEVSPKKDEEEIVGLSDRT